ncbi:hypothetical protein LTR91_006882 [Friedmanniomyces endolithicus]|uniref:4-coumarate--CoA ligase-like 7 n=1 Tax=Friedmanniomyces endolithicus TaxID=329885 RepID=A0AAN6KQS1_9PEZI|nr:hypothetical protein LTR82_007986 [Friedmanniomyces endolithicus]KAK0907057.1 hypothetical protein LTR57_017468 [Friedmanniomyces endolithicus]KAK0996670.1 hypothetical protein LTR91_006882 [Friedmanniomyces endolithicus]KAK1038514.1 hypothetical protein LTS16_012001 [Friedmanniomyces endolithicus]
MLWESPHPRLDIPEHLTTWQWVFETPEYSPGLYTSRDNLGSYINAATKERLDFADVKEKATHLSTALIKDYGLQPGDTVSLFSTNTIWYPVAMWATVRAGGRVNGASPAYNADEMAYALKTASTKFLFTLPSSLEVALAAADVAGLARSNVFLLEGQRDGFTNIKDLIRAGSQYTADSSYRIPAHLTNRDVCGYLNFSSGTTGLPKAVMLSHHNLIAQCHQLKQLQLVSPGQRYKILAVMPLFHITGVVRFCHYPVFMNGDCIMLPSFSMDSMLKTIVEHEIEELILVPPIVIRLVRDPIVDKYLPDLQRIVKRWSSGSAPTAPEITQQLHKKFPNTGFRQGYGATESTACISCHPPTHFDYKYAATAGMLCANTVAKVIDMDDPTRELGPGQTGEICAKGPQIAMGYLNNPTSTAETFKDGFLHTGDVGHIDEEGLLHIEDRIKEMIKVKGQQVPPAELEDLLLGHELVEDCAVLGVPDLYVGERPKAYVVLRAEVQPTEEVGLLLLRFVKAKKVSYKRIDEVEFTAVIPKSPTGKLLRRVLKARDREVNRSKGLCVRDDAERSRL